MDYPVAQLVKEAKVVLDENVSSEALAALGDVDTLTLDEIIRSKVEDAARLVTEQAPSWLVDNGKLLRGSVIWSSQPGYGSGHILLPADFLRLLSFRMSDWSRPVSDAISEDDPRYAMQSSRYGGIRGNAQKPVVAIVHGGSGQVLEFYSCEGGGDVYVKTARYASIPTVDTTGKINLSSKLERAIVYRMASLAATALGSHDLAVLLHATSNELAQIQVNNQE